MQNHSERAGEAARPGAVACLRNTRRLYLEETPSETCDCKAILHACLGVYTAVMDGGALRCALHGDMRLTGPAQRKKVAFN